MGVLACGRIGAGRIGVGQPECFVLVLVFESLVGRGSRTQQAAWHI